MSKFIKEGKWFFVKFDKELRGASEWTNNKYKAKVFEDTTEILTCFKELKRRNEYADYTMCDIDE